MKYSFVFIFLLCSRYAHGQSALLGSPEAAGARVAYVNTDTLEAKYVLLAIKQREFKDRQDKMESELQSAYQKIQDELDELKTEAHSRLISAAAFEAGKKQLEGRQQTLETLNQSMADHLARDREEFDSVFKIRLNRFLEQYNKTKHYDCILAYTWSGSAVLYINKRMDITDAVVKGLNKQAKNAGK